MSGKLWMLFRWIEDCISGEGSLDGRNARISPDGYRAVFAPADVGMWPWSDFGVVEAFPVPAKDGGGAIAGSTHHKGRGRGSGRPKVVHAAVRRRTAGGPYMAIDVLYSTSQHCGSSYISFVSFFHCTDCRIVSVMGHARGCLTFVLQCCQETPVRRCPYGVDHWHRVRVLEIENCDKEC